MPAGLINQAPTKTKIRRDSSDPVGGKYGKTADSEMSFVNQDFRRREN